MEFPDLGKNCSWPPCKELDFLPITCPFCNLIFCKDHVNKDQHQCTVTPDKSDKLPAETFICTYNDCKSRSAVRMSCPKCEKHFCLEHRYHTCFNPNDEDLEAKRALWNAHKQQFAQSLNEVNKIVNEGIKKSMLNPKKQEAALRLNLMRLKAKSQGPNNVPTDNRIYFSIIYEKSPKNQTSKAVFTSRDWSVGRVIDSVSDICNVLNKNNVADAKKLRLFKRLDGCQISSDMSSKIIDLINENKIFNGETLILEYVSPNEDTPNFKLENFDNYIE